MNRLQEMFLARNLTGKIVFTGMYNRLTSMDVRARQIAEEIGAAYVRGRYLQPSAAQRARCVIWVAVADINRVKAIGLQAPQVFDIINPSVEKGDPYFDLVEEFDTLILNTASTLEFLRPRRKGQWRSYVIPHHHCNWWGYIMPEERVEGPKRVGYVGEPGHLHDSEKIQAAVKSLGLDFVCADPYNLAAYKAFDIGVAWTRPEELRDKTRSNIKLTNFCAFGIPSVVCNYESYRDVDRTLGGGACLLAGSIEEFLEKLAELSRNTDLRRSIHCKAKEALSVYSRPAIGRMYMQMVKDIERKQD